MHCFEVRLNGARATLAGVGDDGVMSAIVDWVRRKGQPAAELELSVGGLDDEAHLRWIEQRSLKVGDRVEIIIVEASQPDVPRREPRQGESVVKERERRYFEHLKKKYGW